MSIREIYEKQFYETLKTMQEEKKPCVIFGASRGGWYIAKVFEFYGIAIDYFIDNDIKKQNDFRGYKVKKPEDTPKCSNIFIGILNKKETPEINQKFEKLEPKKIYNLIDVFIFIYFTKVIKRTVNIEEYAKSIFKYFNENKFSKSPTLSYVTTEKCTLNCQECGAFVPNNLNPRTYDSNTIINDIQKYCKAFDVVHHIALQGGEPFLHPKLSEIANEVSRNTNLLFIDFVTNGTIVPSESTLKVLYEEGCTILISDYGEASSKIEELTNTLKKHNIYYDYYSYEGEAWGKQTPIYKRDRGEKTNTKLFNQCISDTFLCMQIMNGKIHRCSFSNNATRLGLIPNFKDDYISLDETLTEEELNEQIQQLAHRRTSLNACDYCTAIEGYKIKAGIQILREKDKK